MSRIEVKVEKRFGATWVIGTVDGREVTVASNQIGGEWGISSSTCLPWDMKSAVDVHDCTEEVLQTVWTIRGNEE